MQIDPLVEVRFVVSRIRRKSPNSVIRTMVTIEAAVA